VDVDGNDLVRALHIEDVGVAIIQQGAFFAIWLTIDHASQVRAEHTRILEDVIFGQFGTDLLVGSVLDQIKAGKGCGWGTVGFDSSPKNAILEAIPNENTAPDLEVIFGGERLRSSGEINIPVVTEIVLPRILLTEEPFESVGPNWSLVAFKLLQQVL
jgi:hypothetical protein